MTADRKSQTASHADRELLREFVLESLDHIHAAEAAILDLENDPDATEPVNTVFRAFHTIKGTSAFLSLDAIQTLAHHAETLLHRARDGRIRLAGGYADLALESCDRLRVMLATLSEKQARDALSLSPHDTELIARLADPESFGIWSPESEPAEPPRLGDLLVAAGLVPRASIEKAVQQQGHEPIGKTLLKQDLASGRQLAGALRMQKRIRGLSDTAVRISAERLLLLLDLVRKLVAAQTAIAQSLHSDRGQTEYIASHLAQAGETARQLQELAQSLHLAPLKPIFQKMARLVRDLSHKHGKDIHFVSAGDDIEISRAAFETLNDSLLQMIRNACDHGIESPQQRRQAGKPPVGTIRLCASRDADGITIKLSDDGKGLDRNALLKQAIQRRLIAPADRLTDNQILMLIFRPGFSTAEQVTDLSGRGVGMDIVTHNLEAVRGSIQVSSTAGQGIEFTLRLPCRD